MATRLICHTPLGQIGVNVRVNGWSASVNGKDMPLDEIASKYHAEIRQTVKDVCKANGWADKSEL